MTDIAHLADLPALAEWMDARDLGCGPITEPTLLAGGTQNIVLKFERAGRAFVLRRPPAHPRKGANETIKRESRILGALVGSDVPCPTLIAAGGPDVFGVDFYLMEVIDGYNPANGLPPLHAADCTIREQMGYSLIDGLSALGAIDHRKLNLDDFGRPDGFLERQVPRWHKQLASYSDVAAWPGPADLGNVDFIADWLESHRPKSYTPGIVHGDFHIANMMFRFDGPDLAAIIDWELTTIADPLLDLGWLIATWPDPVFADIAAVKVSPWQGFPTAAQLFDRYRMQTTRDLESFRWYAVLACFKLGILLEGTFVRAKAGKAPVATGDMLHRDAVNLFRRATRWIDQPTWI